MEITKTSMDVKQKGGRLTVEEAELQGAIDDACKEARLNNGLDVPVYTRVWIRKGVEDYIRKQSVKPGLQADDCVTDKEKAEYLMEKDIWELRKMRQMSKGEPVKNFADMERKARVLLTAFANSIGKPEFSVNPLIQIRALFMDAMFKFGKWDR
jgi:hypothetical protein